MCTNAVQVTQDNCLPKVVCLLIENSERRKEAFRPQGENSFQNGFVMGDIFVGRDFPMCSCLPTHEDGTASEEACGRKLQIPSWHCLPGTGFAHKQFMTEKHECLLEGHE